MALTLTSRDLIRGLQSTAEGVGVPAAAAAVGTMAGQSIAKSSESKMLSIGVGAAGAAMAVKGTGRLVPYAGVGLLFGSIWGMFSKKTEERHRRRGWFW